MVSNTLKIKLQDLLDTLERIKKEHGRDADYKTIRSEFPKDWPI